MLTQVSLVLNEKPPGSVFSTTKMIPPDVTNIYSQPAMQFHLISHVEVLRRLAEKYLRGAQKRYKSDDDKKVHFEPRYVPHGYVFVDRAFLTSSAAERLGAEAYANRLPQGHGTYRLLCLCHEDL